MKKGRKYYSSWVASERTVMASTNKTLLEEVVNEHTPENVIVRPAGTRKTLDELKAEAIRRGGTVKIVNKTVHYETL